MPLLAGPSPLATGHGKLVETGIKVVDVMCPVAAGGSFALAGGYGVGTTVVMEELVRRLSGGRDPVSMFVLLAPPSPEWPPTLDGGFRFSAALKEEGFSEGTVGSVQTLLPLRGRSWTPERLAALDGQFPSFISPASASSAKIYPCVDVLTSRCACSRRMA